MKNKIFIFTSLLLTSILLTGCNKKIVPTTGTTIDSPETSQEESITSNLFDLIKEGKTIKCSFSMSDENGTNSGTTYVSGSKLSSVFKIKPNEGAEIESNTIMDGDWVYIWSTNMPQGTKMKVSEIPSQDADNTTKQQFETLNNPFAYKCSPWTADNTKFIPPSEIQFVDLTETMKQLQNGNTQFCGLCEQAGDVSKVAECKKNLNCE